MNLRKFFIRIVSICLMAALMLCIVPTTAVAASSSEIQEEIDELKDQQKEIKARLKELEKARKENANEIADIVAEKAVLDQQISLLHEQLTNVESQIKALKQMIAEKQDQVDNAVARYEKLNDDAVERIRTMEENGSISYWSILFRANSFTDFLDRINIINEIAESDRNRVEQLRVAAREVEAAKEELESQQAALSETQAQLEADQATLALKRGESDKLLIQLKEKGEEFDALIDVGEEEQNALMEEIAKKKDEFDAAKKREYEAWLAAQPKPKPPVSNGVSSVPVTHPSGWVCPVNNYYISSVFGTRWHPVYGGYRMHNGIDMACAQGTPIYASRGGLVEIAVYSSSAGNYVQLNHGDGYRSVYMHMTHYVVYAGQYVQAGQVIGYVGSTGASTGPHLHWGVSYNGVYFNPYTLIS